MEVKGLSVVVPAYNEEESIGQTLADVIKHLRRKKYPWELIVVDDGSSDATAAQVQQLAVEGPEIRLIRLPENHGKGEAVKRGIVQARQPHCLFMDADNATSITEWDEFERRFADGFQAVIATRHHPRSQITFPQPWPRRMLGAGYRFLCRQMFGLKNSDFNCGFKAYETALAQRIYAQNKMNDWTFDIEALIRMRKEKAAVAEVPVRWAHHPKKSALGPFRTAFKTFRSLWRLKRELL